MLLCSHGRRASKIVGGTCWDSRSKEEPQDHPLYFFTNNPIRRRPVSYDYDCGEKKIEQEIIVQKFGPGFIPTWACYCLVVFAYNMSIFVVVF